MSAWRRPALHQKETEMPIVSESRFDLWNYFPNKKGRRGVDWTFFICSISFFSWYYILEALQRKAAFRFQSLPRFNACSRFHRYCPMCVVIPPAGGRLLFLLKNIKYFLICKKNPLLSTSYKLDVLIHSDVTAVRRCALKHAVYFL